MFGDTEGRHRNPEHVSRQFARDVERCRGALGTDAHVLPGSQRETADRFAAIIAGGNA